MSDLLTHWASFDDCRRLAQADEAIHPMLRSTIESERYMARMGTITFGGSQWMEPVMKSVRSRWADADELAADDARRLGFVLGGLIHQACDKVMKPVLTRAAGVDWSEMQRVMNAGPEAMEARRDDVDRTQEASAYFDAEVFRQVYLGGLEEPFSDLFMATPGERGRGIEDLVRALFQRALLSCHTIKPDFADPEGWIDRLAARVQPLYLDVDRWVKAFVEADPAKIERFGLRSGFYDADDPFIRAARRLQAGGRPDAALGQAVYAEGRFTCAYGEILKVGLDYLRNASVFWTGARDTLAAPNYSPAAAAAG